MCVVGAVPLLPCVTVHRLSLPWAIAPALWAVAPVLMAALASADVVVTFWVGSVTVNAPACCSTRASEVLMSGGRGYAVWSSTLDTVL